MGRIKKLNRYQKVILLFLIAMAMVFGIVYSVVSSRIGFLYNGVILQPSEENGNTIYTGTIKGQDCAFVVTSDKTVTFQCGETTYGPYTAKEDFTAIPQEDDFSEYMTGIEIKDREEIIFRGGILEMGESDPYWLLVNEDGSNASITITAVMSDGTEVDGEGNVVDPMKPSVLTILQLLDGPELTKKGTWEAWFMGIFISIINTISVLFADELFRWNLAFQIRNVYDAEPSDWEIAGRYIGWIALTVIALVVYIMGLQV